MYINWGGTASNPIPTGFENPLNEFFRTQAPILGTAYVHYYISGTDRKPLDPESKTDLGKTVRKAVAILDGKSASSSGRIVELM